MIVSDVRLIGLKMNTLKKFLQNCNFEELKECVKWTKVVRFGYFEGLDQAFYRTIQDKQILRAFKTSSLYNVYPNQRIVVKLFIWPNQATLQ